MEKYSCGLPFLCRRVERKNMPAGYAKNGSPGKRVGLHYRHFEGLFEGRCLQTQRIAHRRFFKRYPNPRSRVSKKRAARFPEPPQPTTHETEEKQQPTNNTVRLP